MATGSVSRAFCAHAVGSVRGAARCARVRGGMGKESPKDKSCTYLTTEPGKHQKYPLSYFLFEAIEQ